MLRYLDVQNILDKNDLILQESGCVGSENERGNTYMKKIGIVTDSHSSISQEEAEKLGIFAFQPMFSYGQRSKCADLLNSYQISIIYAGRDSRLYEYAV